MGKRYKKPNKKINKRKVIKFILFIIIIIGLGLIVNEYYNRTFDAKLVNSQVTVEEQMLEKDKIIEELTNQIQELKNKQTELENKNKELEETIEKVRVSKLNKKTTVTSRSGSTARTESTNSNEKWIWANVSAYCACSKCCGKTNGVTASGTKATV